MFQEITLFLVCGLGSLGQHCVMALKKFGVRVIAIEQTIPKTWDFPEFPQQLEELIIGDCRQIEILERARLQKCRSVLIVTSDEEVNAQTALTVREINSQIRLVVRSGQENLNQLLNQQLGNFFADEPTQLTAAAFALAGLGDETIGFFTLNNHRLQVVKHLVKSDDPWFYRSDKLHELNNKKRHILAHFSEPSLNFQGFNQWEANTQLKPGDTLIYVELVEEFFQGLSSSLSKSRKQRHQWKDKLKKFINRFKLELWQLGSFSLLRQVRTVILVCTILVLLLLIIGTFLFNSYYPETTLLSGFYATVILLLGGYADLFGDFQPVSSMPPWLQFFALSLTIIGTVFVGVLYAALTEALLSAKFQLLRTRPPIPQKDHLVIVGLGKVGQRVASYLNEIKQPQVAITFNPDFDRTILPNIPLIIGNLKESLTQAHLSTAKSIIITTDNEMLNLEIALMTRLINPDSRLVIGAYRKGLSERLTLLLKNTQVISSYSVPNQDAAFDGSNAISRISGCNLALARSLMKSFPKTLPMPFYQHQAQYLLRELSKFLIKAELIDLFDH
ncbi:NAD-binding protein [Crocosphaera sp. XPORK-15E]|uniref:NAD-binding protein n=1 Tax=Crocosphaera sp. XPORK-15E TaxID=3110247 RepID=UPI002B200753|nr:NAD-binding protein [Crocosphaera sp. XPORK-15E]MEA5536643.1 NAD-binding protein [Crocosphaera sp. XPORK-15E]